MDFSELAIPPGSLGVFEGQAMKLMAAWGGEEEMRPCHLVFAADNGILEEGVGKYPQEVTTLLAQNVAEGKAAVSCFCACNGIPYEVIDVGLASQEQVGRNRKVRLGTRNFLKGPAMTRDEYAKAHQAGREAVREKALLGVNVFSFGEVGLGHTTTSAAVLCALSGVTPEFAVGYGANPGCHDVLMRKRQVVAEGIRKHSQLMDSPQDIIRCVGGYDIAALCGAMEECAARNIPFLLDGFITAVAFACAAKNNPQVSQVALSSHLSREPGMKYALELGGLKAEDVPLQAGLALGEGIGAVLGLTLLKTILYTARHMGRMEEIMGKMAQSC